MKIIVTNYQREAMLKSLLNELKGHDVTIVDDCSDFTIKGMVKTPYNYGKKEHWKLWNINLSIAKQSNHDLFMFIPSDLSDIRFDEINEALKTIPKGFFILNVINDGRLKCWNNLEPRKYNDLLNQVFFSDCAFITNRETLNLLEWQILPIDPKRFNNATISSGVGEQLTKRLNARKIPIYTPFYSFAYHGEHESTMHPNERKRSPLTARMKPKITKPIYIGVATFKGREIALNSMLQSIERQTIKPNEVFVYDNEVNKDITDLGKFYKLKDLEDCYFLSCDDDLYYHSTYIEKMINDIQRVQTIVTYHGRQLKGFNLDYYRGHKVYSCLKENKVLTTLDVAGTGVTGFDTSYFHPKDLHLSKCMRMSDLVFSLEARKRGKEITLMPHSANLVHQLDIDFETSCAGVEVKNQSKQIELSNKILSLQKWFTS